MSKYNPARIRNVRAAVGLTQPEVAEAIGKSLSTYVRYESGAILPTVGTLGSLATVLGVDVGELYDADDPTDPIAMFAAELHAMVATMPEFTPEQKARLRVLLRGVA